MDRTVSELVEAVYVWSGEVRDLWVVEGEEPGVAVMVQRGYRWGRCGCCRRTSR